MVLLISNFHLEGGGAHNNEAVCLGFRSYDVSFAVHSAIQISLQMLWYLSTIKAQYGYTVSLIPLAPGHAHNETDGFDSNRLHHRNSACF